MQNFLISIILVTITNTLSEINLIDELCNNGGKWFLAAAGGNADDAPPPSKTCVTFTITDTRKKCDCIFNTFNHTIRRVRMLRVVGRDEENKTEINTMGGFHQWLDNTIVSPEANSISFNSMAKSSICWNPWTFKFKSYSFTATAIAQDPYLSKKAKQSHFIYVVGVNSRMRRSEIHSALLTKEKSDVWEVQNMIKKLGRMFKKEFPPLKIKCAIGFPEEVMIPYDGLYKLN